MVKSVLRVALIGVVILSVAACGVEIRRSKVNFQGIQSFFAYGGALGDFLVDVVGNPFPEPKAEVDRTITDEMYGSHAGPVTNFTTERTPRVRPEYRAVFLFNPPRAFNGFWLCDGSRELQAGPTGERLHVIAGFCVGDRTYTEVRASIPAPATSRDPQFRQMVRNVTQELFPLYDQFERDDDSACAIFPC